MPPRSPMWTPRRRCSRCAPRWRLVPFKAFSLPLAGVSAEGLVHASGASRGVLRRACDSLCAVTGEHAAGALATGNCGAFGYAHDDVSPEAAALRARAQCKGSDCKVVTSFRNTCAAFAIDAQQCLRTAAAGRRPAPSRRRRMSRASNVTVLAAGPASSAPGCATRRGSAPSFFFSLLFIFHEGAAPPLRSAHSRRRNHALCVDVAGLVASVRGVSEMTPGRSMFDDPGDINRDLGTNPYRDRGPDW